MALIKCSECGGQVSDKAASCPHCGAPISRAKETSAAGQELTTIQQTSKKLKLHTVLSVLIAVIGIIVLFGDSDAEGHGASFGALLAIGGLTWFFVTRIRIWWHHS